MRCPECVEVGERSTVEVGLSSSSLMAVQAFWDEDDIFHRHDPNRVTTQYRCSRGHEFSRTSMTPAPCPSCDYPALR